MLANMIGTPHFARCGSVVLNLAMVRAVYLNPVGYDGKVVVEIADTSLVLSGADAEAARVLFNPLCVERLMADARMKQALA